MAAGRKGTSKNTATTADLLVERQAADGPQKPDGSVAELRSGQSTEDRSFANIHTGGRAVYQSVNIAAPAGAAIFTD